MSVCMGVLYVQARPSIWILNMVGCQPLIHFPGEEGAFCPSRRRNPRSHPRRLPGQCHSPLGALRVCLSTRCGGHHSPPCLGAARCPPKNLVRQTCYRRTISRTFRKGEIVGRKGGSPFLERAAKGSLMCMKWLWTTNRRFVDTFPTYLSLFEFRWRTLDKPSHHDAAPSQLYRIF